MGFREPVRRLTLADANELRDWRIYAEFAHRLIAKARRLFANESLGLDLDNTVYALDSTTIDLCLSVFPWAHFRKTKAALKMHTLLDLRGNIPSLVHVFDGQLRDVHALDLLVPEPGSIYVMDDCMRSIWPELSSSRGPSRTWWSAGFIRLRPTAPTASSATRRLR
jgi:hypothetical protein